ncbi:GRAM-domain-containing protein [Hesseltinella vesiculosa]|uniref:GRAM-domain-containing protein n=1 Tax=Hesseltinella vesiculosa TaxID=101127 RepID=A0A1X2GMP2_9FUNG|nr:GRAM-domain-containing protein [Hesseltinella vesiculosa]
MEEPITPLPSRSSGSPASVHPPLQELEKTLSTSTCTLSNDSNTSLPGNCSHASSKDNAYFHALFKSVPEDDHLLDWYKCALQRDILLQGHVYVSEQHVCFHSNIFGWVTNLVIQYTEITEIERRMTAMVIPNGIQINTQHAKHTFASFIYREAAYLQMVALWERHHQPLPPLEEEDEWDSEASCSEEDTDTDEPLEDQPTTLLTSTTTTTSKGLATTTTTTSSDQPSPAKQRRKKRTHRKNTSTSDPDVAAVSASVPPSDWKKRVAWKPLLLLFLTLHTLWMLRQWTKMEKTWQHHKQVPLHLVDDDTDLMSAFYDRSQHHRLYQRLEHLRQRMDDLNQQILDQQWKLYDLSPSDDSPMSPS